MITGGPPKWTKVSKKDVLIVKGFLDQSLNEQTEKTFDEYIHSVFSSFCIHKKQIILNLHNLYEADKTIRSLFMFKMERRRCWRETVRGNGDFSNLFRAETFRMFTNLKTMIIQTSSFKSDGLWSYSLSMTELLRSIESLSLDQVIVKAVDYDKNWIKSLWTEENEKRIQKEYAAKKYGISMIGKNDVGNNYAGRKKEEYCFIIKKQ